MSNFNIADAFIKCNEIKRVYQNCTANQCSNIVSATRVSLLYEFYCLNIPTVKMIKDPPFRTHNLLHQVQKQRRAHNIIFSPPKKYTFEETSPNFDYRFRKSNLILPQILFVAVFFQTKHLKANIELHKTKLNTISLKSHLIISDINEKNVWTVNITVNQHARFFRRDTFVVSEKFIQIIATCYHI